MHGRAATLVPEKVSLDWRLKLRAKRDRVVVVPDKGAVDYPPSAAETPKMQVSLTGEIRSPRLVPLINPSVEVGVWTVHPAETYRVTMHEANHFVVHRKIDVDAVCNDPVQVGISLRQIVKHKVLQRVPLSRTPMLL